MAASLTRDDRGKEVVWNRQRVGVVTDVRSGTASVDPDWDNVSDDLEAALGWDEETDTYRIEEPDVAAVANDQVRLRDNLR